MSAFILQKGESADLRNLTDEELDIVGGGNCTRYTTIYTDYPSGGGRFEETSNSIRRADGQTCDQAWV